VSHEPDATTASQPPPAGRIEVVRLIRRNDRLAALVAAVFAMSAVVGLAGHWFAAWLLAFAGSLIFVGWSLREDAHRRRALLDARTEVEHVRDLQRTLRADLDQARAEASAAQQEARADIELLRAEIAVASDPEHPDDQSGG
jgi:thiosulfate reductase cytochrome b subunit